jgi:hypothetical protein
VTLVSVMFVGKLVLSATRVTGDRSFQRWNIYHLACLSQTAKTIKFVDHLLQTLPAELTNELMAQTSKEALNTVQSISPMSSVVPLIKHGCSL